MTSRPRDTRVYQYIAYIKILHACSAVALLALCGYLLCLLAGMGSWRAWYRAVFALSDESIENRRHHRALPEKPRALASVCAFQA